MRGAGGGRPVHPQGWPGSGGAGRSVPGVLPAPGAPARAAPPGAGERARLHPSCRPAGAGTRRSPRTLRARGSPMPPPQGPPRLRSWRSRSGCCPLPAALPGCFRPAIFLPSPQDSPPGRDGERDAGGERSPQDPGGAGGNPRGGDGGCRPGEALTGLCLAGCRSWEGCGEGGRRRESPGLHPPFIAVQLLRDDLGGESSHKRVGFLAVGCSGSGRLGPACINAEQPQWQPEPKETVGRATKCPSVPSMQD